jgi:phosphohistidine phosphatase
MVLLLLRHGEAEDGSGDDDARRLTPKGETQAVAAGEAIAALGIEVDACLSSPKLRAADTARLACRALGIDFELAQDLGGGPFDGPGLAAGRGAVLLVGHEPALSDEISRLTGGRVKLKKGGLAIVDGGTLLALMGPKELAAIAASR